MHYVIEAQFDEATTNKLAIAKSQFHQGGFSNAPEGTPHLSLSSFEYCEPKDWEASFDKFSLSNFIEVEFSFIGVFSLSAHIIYLGVTSTQAILNLHKNIHEEVLTKAKGIHDHYYPDKIVFHSTLAAPVEHSNLGKAVEFAAELDLPKSATIDKIALVRYSPATIVSARNLKGAQHA